MSASRPILTPFPVIVNGDMSADIISNVTIITNLSVISYDVSWTGVAPVGTMSVQVSNTYSINADGSERNPGNWTTLTLSSPTPVSGATGNGAIDVRVTGFYAIRLVYNRVSGTGSMQAVVNGKVT